MRRERRGERLGSLCRELAPLCGDPRARDWNAVEPVRRRRNRPARKRFRKARELVGGACVTAEMTGAVVVGTGMSGGGTKVSIGTCWTLGCSMILRGGGGGGGGGSFTSSMIVAVSGFLITWITALPRPDNNAQMTSTCTRTTKPIPTRCLPGSRCCRA